MSNYEEAMKWLRLMKNISYRKEERDLIEWIMDKLYFDNDMRNS